MKKTATLALVLSCAVGLTLGLAACDKTDPTPPAQESTDQTVKEVTSEVWDQCFSSLTNLTFHTDVTTLVHEQTIKTNTVTKIDGDKAEQIQTGDNEIHFIAVKNGTTYTEYDYNETTQRWTKLNEATPGTYYIQSPVTILGSLKGQFSKFTLTEGAYTCASFTADAEDLPTDSITLSDIKVEFKDGKLEKVTFTVVPNEGSTAAYVADTFGTTSVTVPTDYDEESPSPSAA